MRVTVVGAGVVGLATARELESRGHDVQVVADRRGDDTTSAVAGAIWFPYQAGSSPEVAAWAHRTRERLLALGPDAGVDVLRVYECAGADPPRPWWAGTLDVVLVPAPVRGAPLAWRFDAPRVIPAVFLRWLEAGLRRPVRDARVEDPAALEGDAVVVCAGLRSRRLTSDPALAGVLGQVVVVEPGTIPLDVSLAHDLGPAPLFYSIPRRDTVLLGGTSVPWAGDEPPPPDPEVTARILARCRELGWEPGRVVLQRTGLRPVRPAPRLERAPADPRIVYHYGHGGAGFTLCLGCAEAVADRIDGR